MHSCLEVEQEAPRPPDHVARPTSGRRAIAGRTQGMSHGPVTRFVNPWDIGELIKPFVSLEYFDFAPTRPLFPVHPHSGIATITILLSGSLQYSDTTGRAATLLAGGVEWTHTGHGAWHDSTPHPGERVRGFELWLALPEASELSAPQSQYLRPDEVESDGPARVILATHGHSTTSIASRNGITLLHVRLACGQEWTFHPPPGQQVAWLHAGAGGIETSGTRLRDELAVFEESDQPIRLLALDDVDLIVGSAIKHPHDLVTGYYSVHTSEEALALGEAEIARIGKRIGGNA
jgi:redox-sensitive bicupin YhaK (pirin superfamily)